VKLSASAPAVPASRPGLRSVSAEDERERRRQEQQAREDERDRISALRNGLQARNLIEVVTEIAKKNFVTVADILGRSRDKSIVRARHQVFAALRAEPFLKSTPEIAKLLGVDQGTVRSGSTGRRRRR
jgi:chromosomal replication initiation ATPase DnaA